MYYSSMDDNYLPLVQAEQVRDRLMRWLKEAHERAEINYTLSAAWKRMVVESQVRIERAEARRDAARRCYEVAEESNREYVAANTELKHALDAALADAREMRRLLREVVMDVERSSGMWIGEYSFSPSAVQAALDKARKEAK